MIILWIFLSCVFIAFCVRGGFILANFLLDTKSWELDIQEMKLNLDPDYRQALLKLDEKFPGRKE